MVDTVIDSSRFRLIDINPNYFKSNIISYYMNEDIRPVSNGHFEQGRWVESWVINDMSYPMFVHLPADDYKVDTICDLLGVKPLSNYDTRGQTILQGSEESYALGDILYSIAKRIGYKS